MSSPNARVSTPAHSQDFEDITLFHKTFQQHPSVSKCVEDLGNFAIDMAQNQVKAAKVLILESILLEGLIVIEDEGDSKKVRSAIAQQTTFLTSNSLNISESDILPLIMQKTNALTP